MSLTHNHPETTSLSLHGETKGGFILIFGGTTEGRLAVKVLEEAGKPFFYSTKGSGQQVQLHNGQRLCGAMNQKEMRQFCMANSIGMIVDAAHPFAENLHHTIAEVADELSIPVVRLQRPEVERHDEVIYCRDFSDALQHLEALQPTLLLALTGSNTIEKLRPWWEKHDTILRKGNQSPTDSTQEEAHLHIITTPLSTTEKQIFDYEEERTMMQKYHCDAMITKQSGGNGAEDTKVRAALDLGMKVLVVERPGLPESFISVTGEHGLRRSIEHLMPEFFPLRTGFTTGACATAAAKAALICLLTGEEQHEVFFTLPNGEVMQMELESTKVEYTSGNDAEDVTIKTIKAVECAVRKDAGDDPDVTNGAIIRVKVSPSSPPRSPLQGEDRSYNCTSNVRQQDFSQQDSTQQKSQHISQQATPQQNIGNVQFTPEGWTKGCSHSSPRGESEGGITFLGGPGVGTVTLPGLGIPVGEPAINPTPRRMIEQEFASILNSCSLQYPPLEETKGGSTNLQFPSKGGAKGGYPPFEVTKGGFSITISVDGGEELASRTFNSRVGVVGGISIIGTSGIVRPFSNEAFIESIRREMEVAVAVGCNCLVINSGAKSERFLKAALDKRSEDIRYRFIHYGNAIGETLKMACELAIPHIIMGVMIGKAVKLAEGHLDTHSHHVTMNREFISQMLQECGADTATISQASTITLARELWETLPQHLLKPFADNVKRHCNKVCSTITNTSTRLDIILIDESGNIW